MPKRSNKTSKQSPFAGDDLTPTVFVYNEPGINGKDEIFINGEITWRCCDGIKDRYNENANLLSIVQHLIDEKEPYKLDNSIRSFRDHNTLAEKLDVYPSFFFMTDMEAEINNGVVYSNPRDKDWLPELSKSVLRDYVFNGGTIVQTGTVGNYDVYFLNEIFDLGLKNIANPSSSWSKNSDNVEGLISKDLFLELDRLPILKDNNSNDGVESIDASSIKEGTFTPYYGTESDSVFGVIEYGEGKIYYIGSDYRKSGYESDWGQGLHQASNGGGQIHRDKAYVQKVLPAILQQAAKEAKENFPFPYNYQDDDGDFKVKDCKPIKENSFELGSGQDVLINCCSLEVTGEGEIDLGAGNDRMETNMFISASKLDGGADRDELILTDENSCEENFEKNENMTVRSMKIVNFEDIQVEGGTWEFAGNFKKADIVISGGSLSVPVLKRRSSGLRTKSLNIKGDGTMEIDLSDPDVIADDLSGKWLVLRAKKGLGGLFEDQMNEINVFSPAGYGYEVSLNPKETKLIVELYEII